MIVGMHGASEAAQTLLDAASQLHDFSHLEIDAPCAMFSESKVDTHSVLCEARPAQGDAYPNLFEPVNVTVLSLGSRLEAALIASWYVTTECRM